MDRAEQHSEGASRPRRPPPLVITALVAVAAVVVTAFLFYGRGSATEDDLSRTAAPPSPSTTSAITRVDGNWTVRALYDEHGQPALSSSWRHRVTLGFHSGTMTGDTGCNSISGHYRQETGRLVFSDDLFTSLVGCLEEPPLLSRLGDVRTVSGSGHVRYLRDTSGAVAIELQRRR